MTATSTANTQTTQTPHQPHPSPKTPPEDHSHEPLRSQMRRYFSLNLRADQARASIHHHLQQNRYTHVFHGPPYERVEHWERCLAAAKRDYDDAEATWRGILSRDDGGREGVVDVRFMERVRERADELEEVLRGMGELGEGCGERWWG